MATDVPIISVVGKSNSGKTTLICRLIIELKKRGYRVATIKHDRHDFEIDRPGKDTWQHSNAGADSVVISSPKKIAMIESIDNERSIDDIVPRLDNTVDIVITEGYKKGDKPKIEVVNTNRHPNPICLEDHSLIAMASDKPEHLREQGVVELPLFSWDDAQGLVDLLIDYFSLDAALHKS